MADAKRAYAENVAGDFFVDDTCIDCDLCRQIEPSVFAQRTDHSIVYQQPGSENAVKRSAMALVTCPTGSIGTRQKHDLRAAIAAYPELIDENVYFCGFAARNSYGGASYFILRPEGNLLIDSPRFASQLAHRLEELGGVSTMFLTHRDDVADHEKFREHFGCERIVLLRQIRLHLVQLVEEINVGRNQSDDEAKQNRDLFPRSAGRRGF